MSSATTYVCICIYWCAFFSCTQPDAKQEIRVLPFYTTADFTPVWIKKGDPGYNRIHSIPAFSFIDQSGNTITQQTFAGKVYVADFFFTACPGICKKLTSHLALVQKAYQNDKDVLLLSHSVMPEADSVPRLNAYAKTFGAAEGKWFLVTGNRNAVYQIARTAYFADEDMGLKKNSNDFLHTENMLLIDKHRRIRGVYKGTSPADIKNLIADIKILKEEE